MRLLWIIFLIVPFLRGEEYLVQNTWNKGPGNFYSRVWNGFWKGENVDYFRNNGLSLLESNFFMFYPRNILGNYGTVNRMFSINPDTVFIAVNLTDTARIFYTLFYKGFSPNQYIILGDNVRDLIVYQGFLKIGAEAGIFRVKIANLPANPQLEKSMPEFRNFTIWQGNLYAIQGGIYRYVLKYQSGTWQEIYRFDGNVVNDLVFLFSEESKGIFVLARKDSIWKLYHSLNGYPPFFKIKSPQDSIGYVIKGICDSENLYVLIKSPARVLRYSFSDSSWQRVLSGDAYTVFEDIIYGKGKTIYVIARRSVFPKNILFSSYDGKNFYPCDTLDGVLGNVHAFSINYSGEGHSFIGTENDPEILYSVFPEKASIVSSAIKIEKTGSYPVYKKFIAYYEGGEIRIKLRTFSDSVICDTVPWNSIPYLEDSLLENYSGISQGKSYFQYKLEILPFSQVLPFVLDSVKLAFEYDSVGPFLISAVASDGEWQSNGKDPDDRVILVFNEPTDKCEINKFNVDSILRLSGGHSWKNVYGDFGGAEWNGRGDTLVIFLAYSGNQYPSVSAGDTVYAKMKDRFGFYNESWTIIQGTFDDQRGPVILRAVASDGNIKEDGIDGDDFLVILFSEGTNMPDFDTIDINLVFNLSGGHTFGSSVNACWVRPDSLIINLIPSSNPTVRNEDTIYPSPFHIFDSLGNPAEGYAIIQGTFDEKIPRCDSIILYENNFIDTLLDPDDFVIFYFSEPLEMKREVNELVIDHAFKLSRSHSWLSGNGKTGELIFNNDMFIVFFNFEGGSPSVFPGDSVYINPLYFSDYGGNPLADTQIIRYSGSLKIFENSEKQEEFVMNFPFDRKIIFERDARDIEINLYNIAGRCLGSIKLKYIKKGEEVVFEKLKKGIYFIEVKTEKFKGMYKKVILK